VVTITLRLLLLLPPPPVLLQVSADGCNPYHCWENDYHAARKDSNGMWSWKEPGGPATNLDMFGKLIEDPEATNVTVHYDIFCGYYNVVPSEMTIDAETRSDSRMSIEQRVKYYSNAIKTAPVWAEPLPYNETTDGAFDAGSEQLQEEDRLWESKRGSKEWEEWHSKQGASNGQGSSPPSRSGRKLRSLLL
jgi:hypothetical protein